jgi:hypothetical protein
LISPEAFSKFLDDLQKQIVEVDKANKLKAENILREKGETYRQKVSERLAHELASVEECRRVGDDIGAKHHLTLSEVYKSLFAIQT